MIPGRSTKEGPDQRETDLSSVLDEAPLKDRSSLRVAEVAEILEITPQHVIDLCAEGVIKGINVAGANNRSSRRAIRIPVSALRAYLRTRQAEPI